MTRPPFRGTCLLLSPIVLFLVSVVGFSLCLPLYPFLFPFVGWCLHLSQQGLVSSCLRLYPFFFPFVGCCAPSCFPLLDGVSAFPRVLFPFVAHCRWCVRLSEGLVSQCFPLSPHTCACVGWGLVLPACVGRRIRLPEVLSPLVSPRLPLPPIVSSQYAFVLDGASASPRGLSPDVLFPLVSHCLPTRVPVLDGVPPFPRSCLSLSSIVFPHVCLC